MTCPSDVFAVLRAIVDGKPEALTAEQAKSIHAELWDNRQRLALLEQRIALANRKNEALNSENNQIVAQVVSEERRAVRLEIEKAECVALIADGIDEMHNPKRWRAKATAWLSKHSR